MKKLTYKDFAMLARYTRPHRLMLLSCTFWGEDEKYDYVISAKQTLLSYILLVIPVHIIELFAVLWDGGLREYTIEKPFYVKYRIAKTSEAYKTYQAKGV